MIYQAITQEGQSGTETQESCADASLCNSMRTILIPSGMLTQRTPLTVYLCTLLQH